MQMLQSVVALEFLRHEGKVKGKFNCKFNCPTLYPPRRTKDGPPQAARRSAARTTLATLLRGEDSRWYYSDVRVRNGEIAEKGGPPAPQADTTASEEAFSEPGGPGFGLVGGIPGMSDTMT